jgi:outer membrane protein
MKTIFKYTAIIISVVVLTSFAFVSHTTSMKAAFVKNTELYNNFPLKKELETQLISTKNKRQSILDSMLVSLKALSSVIKNGKNNERQLAIFKMQRDNYLVKQKEFDEDNQRLAEQYSQQIWKQINQYVEDFGKSKGYGFIYGATGDGALMYADASADLTKEISEYINGRYTGNK